VDKFLKQFATEGTYRDLYNLVSLHAANKHPVPLHLYCVSDSYGH